jgi:hypothetical protein
MPGVGKNDRCRAECHWKSKEIPNNFLHDG